MVKVSLSLLTKFNSFGAHRAIHDAGFTQTTVTMGSKMRVVYDHLTPKIANQVISHFSCIVGASAAALRQILLRIVSSTRLKQAINPKPENASDPPGCCYLFSLGVFDLGWLSRVRLYGKFFKELEENSSTTMLYDGTIKSFHFKMNILLEPLTLFLPFLSFFPFFTIFSGRKERLNSSFYLKIDEKFIILLQHQWEIPHFNPTSMRYS